MEKLFNTQVLQLGRQGENGARIIRADVSQWLETYPNGEILLFATRPNELVPYIPADYQVADGILTWTISNVDTGTSGNGRAELRLMDGETIVKSEVVNTEVVPCLPGTGSPVTPTPEVTDWVTRFIDSAETVDEALENADAAVAELDAAIAHAGDIVEVMQDKAPAILSTAGPADVATFSDGAAGMPMEVTVALDPIQAGSGDPAPDNVRAISGYSAVKIDVAGKNLFSLANKEVNGVTFTIESDGTYSIFGTATNSVSFYLRRPAYGDNALNFPCVLSIENFNWEASTGGLYATDAVANERIISGRKTDGVVECNNGIAAIWFYISAGETVNVSHARLMIRKAGTDSEFEPYIGSIKTITFPTPPGTVYGGTLTVNRDGTGKLVVDRQVIDLGSLSPTYNANRNWYFSGALSALARIPATDDENPNIVAEQYISYAYNDLAGNADLIGISYNTANRLVIRTGSQESLPTGKIVYYLATPITYDLTAEQVGQITSVKGVNNVWSAGQVEVTYAADTKTYVDGVAEDVDGIQTTLADYSSVKSKANAALAGGTFTRDSSSGFPWDSGGVLGYNYTCKIPLGGTISGRAVFVSVTAAANNQLSALMNALAPFNKVDAAAGYVYLYANTNQYKPTQIKVVVI